MELMLLLLIALGTTIALSGKFLYEQSRRKSVARSLARRHPSRHEIVTATSDDRYGMERPRHAGRSRGLAPAFAQRQSGGYIEDCRATQ